MRKSKLLAVTLAGAMSVASLAGCSSSSSTSSTTAADTTAADKGTDATKAEESKSEESKTDETTKADGESKSDETEASTPAETTAPVEHKTAVNHDGDPVTITVFSQLANYSGEQKGWSASYFLDKFNVVMNIVNDPYGDQISTRLQTGDLGDIVVWGSTGSDYQTAVEGGMLLNWNKDNLLEEYGWYMNEYMKNALDHNAEINDGTCYGIGYEVATSDDVDLNGLYTWDVRYDLYVQLGSPKVKDLNDFVELLKQMKEICPTDENGKETYAVSIWPDWDGNMVMYVKSFATSYYGYDEWGVGLYDPKTGGFHGALEENGPYYISAKFFNKLYQEGLVDPNSMTQSYDNMSEKVKAGGVFFSEFNYAGSSIYNTDEHVADNKMMLPLVPEEASPIVYGLDSLGGNRVWSIGSTTQYPELCMEIINWLATPEGMMTYMYGPQGVTWDYDADGYAYFTELGLKTQSDKTTDMSEAGYTGNYNDGSWQVNNNIWSLSAVNTDSKVGEPFSSKAWKSTQLDPKNDTEAAWREMTGQTQSYAYINNLPNKVLAPATGYSFNNPGTGDEVQTAWNAVTKEIVSGTWKCIYATSDAEFDELWTEMVNAAKGYGYDDCVAFSEEQAEVRHAYEEALTED